MPIDLSTNQIIEKNKLASVNVELVLLEITYFTEDPVRVCLNNDTITWNSETWYPALFSLSGLRETKDAEIPEISLSFIDIGRQITPHIETYNGGIGADITIYVVDSLYLSNTTPKTEESMEIIDCSINSKNQVTLKLGAENLSILRCPQHKYRKNHCRFEFKGSDGRCGYTGAETECDRSFSDCEDRDNSARFGGFPGVGGSGFQV